MVPFVLAKITVAGYVKKTESLKWSKSPKFISLSAKYFISDACFQCVMVAKKKQINVHFYLLVDKRPFLASLPPSSLPTSPLPPKNAKLVLYIAALA